MRVVGYIALAGLVLGLASTNTSAQSSSDDIWNPFKWLDPAPGRTPQPASGYLPETGVLADLAQAAQRRDTDRTVLVAMRALGPNGAEGANILALGDTVRALKRAGLEPDARRIAFEALFAFWPRVPGN